ncbi:lytic murein transglycosylase B [Chromatiales bacterium (ex Bugula neritina AB1)]|nr:lytic murein transglycosylase B [Chromatiales bacterium (ex Bugula neritina AB1)]
MMLWLCSHSAYADYSEHPKAVGFMAEMVRKHDMDTATMKAIFSSAERSERVLELIQRPAEKRLEWSGYRPIFMSEERINAGVDFWNTHQEILEKAQLRYGVPAWIIVSIIGVETFYGRISGGFSAISALSTLAFDYPRRAKFFRSELEQFLLLLDENNLDYQTLEGSYAAAFGMPQFISSSYRSYAVDFDGDGDRDLWNSVPDVVGSVANYFYRHGWKNGQSVAEITELPASAKSLVRDSPKPVHSLNELNTAGIYPKRKGSGRYTLLKLQAEQGAEYWIAHHNFYVITRYNHSNLYAMAVYQLSQEIKARMRGLARTE